MSFFKKNVSQHQGNLNLVDLKKNLQINLNPDNAKPVVHYKSFFIEVNKCFKDSHGYVSDFLGTGEPGIMVHGSMDGRLKIVTEGVRKVGSGVRSTHLTPREFYYYLIRRHSLDLAKDKRPLHLVACYSGAAEPASGKLSAAQELANITQRKIWAYGEYEEVRFVLGGLPHIINKVDVVRNVKGKHLKAKLIEPDRRYYLR
ncbi:hypothetical protein F3J29_05635 [Enterobacter sp. Cy-643]|uniref:hypothetical protein n=1 Tax=Enterobacter sp. Cy-643 TaxID=2608346 RepID=UPI00141D8E14|nr:hypothetical protein [Enterobacter sp. Cy-643]NIF31615.1 hypothetical protein [Enterobacter sp. Cy-643]